MPTEWATSQVKKYIDAEGNERLKVQACEEMSYEDVSAYLYLFNDDARMLAARANRLANVNDSLPRFIRFKRMSPTDTIRLVYVP